MIYFDNAATSFPKPPSVPKAVSRALLKYGANPGRSGHRMAAETAAQVYLCREKAAALFACQPEQVIFTQNCSHAINLVLHGLLKRGDHVLISDLEHNAVARPLHQLYKEGICSYTIVPTSENDEETVENFRRAIRPDSKLIFCTHGSNVFGNILPVEALSQLAHRYGLLFAADCAQSGGVLDLSRTSADFLCLPGHKGLYGPTGTGLLICRRDVPLRPLMQGGTGSDSLSLDMPDFLPEGLESGTVNTAGILGLSAGIDYVNGHGCEKIYGFEYKLCRRIYGELSEVPWVHFYGPKPTFGKTLPLLSLTLGSMNGTESAQWLNDSANIAARGGFHCAKLAHEKMNTAHIGTCRISPGSFNTMDDVRALCSAVKKRRIG